MPAFTKIELKIQPPIARLTLANPPQNVVDLAMMREFKTALEQVARQGDVCALLISGTRGNFSAGVDVAAHRPESVREMLTEFHGVIRALVDLKKVTVAWVEGNCLGGGAELALVCDVAYTTIDAKWGFPEIKLGCFPPVAATALAACVGQKRAAELILSGTIISGRDAALMGLASACGDLSELQSMTAGILEKLSELSPSSLAITKRAIYLWDAMHFEKGLARAEQIYFDELMKTEDAKEGIEAWLEKRKPKWCGK